MEVYLGNMVSVTMTLSIVAQDIGRLFWKDLMQCNAVLNQEFLLALSTCIPTSTLDEAESTRVYICSCPEKWVKMMDCLNMHLIQMQDDKNPHLEVGPSAVYRECVSVLIQEAEHSMQTGEPFLPESSFENASLTKS
ncbi:hypothetical protein AVEN_167069-1 [Araneus ventricosus]|uniref:Uncharacterized protein n=1 Tax=Araneus ventricosus TaxID=182803 RepID=A0A4Y2CPV7_ARAVE|nr:hypothetical protein AVEN_167069-1 [Araneus ventricosus]